MIIFWRTLAGLPASKKGWDGNNEAAHVYQLVKLLASSVGALCPFPIPMAYPNATIYELEQKGIHNVSYEDTRHYEITRDLLQPRERFLKHLPNSKAALLLDSESGSQYCIPGSVSISVTLRLTRSMSQIACLTRCPLLSS